MKVEQVFQELRFKRVEREGRRGEERRGGGEKDQDKDQERSGKEDQGKEEETRGSLPW